MGDLNSTPEEMARFGWLNTIDRFVAAPSTPTCRTRRFRDCDSVGCPTLMADNDVDHTVAVLENDDSRGEERRVELRRC